MSESQQNQSKPRPPHLQVFLCHAHEDKEHVLALYLRLVADGIKPWLDKRDLLPGQEWEIEIPKAVQDSDVVIACLSQHSASKAGYVQKEVRLALDTADLQPSGTIFIIPLRLEAFSVPDRLRRWHWCDYFEDDGYDLLLRALRHRAQQLGLVLEEIVTPPPPPAPPPPDPVRALLNAREYSQAVAMLEPRAREGDTSAALLLGEIVETAAAPRDLRFQAAGVLTKVGDPRPGVCSLPPSMVRIEGGTFVIGNPKGEEQYDREINEKPMTIATFEIARYPITNAQYKLFIDNDGYNPDRLWWDEAGRAWLQRDDETTEGLESWQKREYKHQPELWNNERFGIARPNHPVVGISWYEAVAFCRWLTQRLQDGYTYRLPTEAEWEYAARRATRRTYPWGNEEPDGERANFNRAYEGTTAVGCFPLGATPEDGLQDMAGNVWEWTGSIFKPYPYDATDGREDISTPSNKSFVFRGGGWDLQSLPLRTSDRSDNSPDYHNIPLGFRPARHLP